jgi:hypothetical protein
MLDRFEDSERLLQQCPEGNGNKKFTSFFLFLTWICLSVAVIQLGHSRPQKYMYTAGCFVLLWGQHWRK